jgi:hypothetical protein
MLLDDVIGQLVWRGRMATLTHRPAAGAEIWLMISKALVTTEEGRLAASPSPQRRSHLREALAVHSAVSIDPENPSLAPVRAHCSMAR